MAKLEELAKDLRMKPDELMKESLETFLKHRLKVVESELFLLAKRYGVGDVHELDRMIQEGKLHEQDAFEDYFRFDNLEAERNLLLTHLEEGYKAMDEPVTGRLEDLDELARQVRVDERRCRNGPRGEN